MGKDDGDRPSRSGGKKPQGDDPKITDLRRERTYRFEKTSVDPDKLYVRAHDDKGHSEWVRVRMPPDLYDELMQYVGKRSPFGYRTVSAAMRDALVHRLGYLVAKYGEDEQQKTSFQRFLAEQDFAEEIAIQEDARRWVAEIRDQMDSLVTDYTARNQLPVALDKLRHWLGELPGHEEAHHVYIEGYILGKIAEVQQAIKDQLGGSSRS